MGQARLRVEPSKQFERLCPSIDVADKVEIRLTVEKCGKSTPHDSVVVHN
jgi:hypothetical protein